MAGEDNGECDDLSRKNASGSMRSVAEVLGDGVEDLGLSSDSDISELIELCDPGRLTEQDAEYWVFWGRAVKLVNSLSPGRTSI